MAVTLYKIGSQNFVVDAIASIGGNNLITLYVPNGVSASRYQTLFRDTTAAAYQVTAGKTLYVIGAQMQIGATFGQYLDFGYGDTSVTNSVAAPTSNKSFVASTGWYTGGSSTNTTYAFPLWYCIPAAKYVYVQASSGTAVAVLTLWCVEQ